MNISRKPTRRKPPPDITNPASSPPLDRSLSDSSSTIANSSESPSKPQIRTERYGERSINRAIPEANRLDSSTSERSHNNESRSSTSDVSQNPAAKSDSSAQALERQVDFQSCLQLFWKFHIEKFDPGFYLTTNPTLRHVQCRSSPGYFVTVHKDSMSQERGKSRTGKLSSTDPAAIELFLMVFEDTVTGEPIVVVRSTARELEYDILVKRAVINGKLVCEQSIDSADGTEESAMETMPVENQDSSEQKVDSAIPLETDLNKPVPPPLPPRHLPAERLNTAESISMSSNYETCQGRCVFTPISQAFFPLSVPQPATTNYETDLAQKKFNLGNIPQARELHLPRVTENKKDVQMVRKRYIYLHREFLGTNTQYADLSLALVLALIRPCETRAKKRFLRKIHSLSNSGRIGQSSSLWKEWPDWDWNEWTDPSDWSPNNYRNENLQLLLPDVKPYTDIGDGLHFDKVPIDDEPDHMHKYGWLTIYDLAIFEEAGVFDSVVALTVAASYESWQF